MYRFDTAAAAEQLAAHRARVAPLQLRDLFATDPQRFAAMSLNCGPLLIDYSKNRVTSETLRLLFDLAREANIEEQIQAMFRGEKINNTENRAVLHTALRNRTNTPVIVDGVDVMPQINDILSRMRTIRSTRSSADCASRPRAPVRQRNLPTPAPARALPPSKLDPQGAAPVRSAVRVRWGGPFSPLARDPIEPGRWPRPLVYTGSPSHNSTKVFCSFAVNLNNDGHRRFFVRARQC